MVEESKTAAEKMTEVLTRLEALGVVERTGEFRRGALSGSLRPVYRPTELGRRIPGNLLPEEAEEILTELEALGLIECTGKFRHDSLTGCERPVYRITELGRRMQGPLLTDDETEH